MPEKRAFDHDLVHSKTKSNTSRYRPEIDGVRAFAVVAVIVNHFNKNILPGGYLGVDIFFVISGYVITSSLFGRPSDNFKDFITGFYERRIKRLVPALSLFALITSIATLMFIPYPELTLRTGITSLFGLSNLYLLKQSTDYFAQSTELNSFTHTWSLGVEEQFYILFPFLIWFSGFGRQTKNGSRNLFMIIGTLAIASIVMFFYLYRYNQPAAYFLMPSRFWEMAAGCLIFLTFQKHSSVGQVIEKVPPLLILALITAVMYLPMSLAATSTIAVVALSSALIASLKKETIAFQVLTNPKVVYVGLISYSLYLWHWGVLSISRWTIGIHWWSIPLQVGLMLGLAIASYRCIETPLRKRNWFKKRWKTLLIGTGGLIITSISLAAVSNPSARKLFASIGNKIYPPTYFAKPGIPQQDLYCHLPQKIESAFQDCLTPKEANAQSGNIFLVGDSHASNHYWSIRAALNQTKSEFALNTLVEYGLIQHLTGVDECGRYNICIRDAGSAYKNFFSSNLKAGDYILISISRDRFTVGDFHGSPRKQKYENLEILHKRLLALSQITEQHGASIILIGDIPKVCGHGINYEHTIIRNGNTEECTIEKTKSINDRIGLNNVFIDLANTSESIFFVDPHNELCSEEYCSVINHDGIVLYGDTSPHFSMESKEILTDYWLDTFTRIGIADESKQ